MEFNFTGTKLDMLTQPVINLAQNASSPSDGCFKIMFSRMEFLPWNNSDTIVSENVRVTSSQVKAYALLSMLLIGVPANVINLAVFYRQGLKDRVTLCLFALSFADWFYLTWSFFYNVEITFHPFLAKGGISSFVVFFVNNYMLGILGFYYASPILSAIIAVDRCVCVFYPLRVQRLLSARSMGVIIVFVFLLGLGCTFPVSLKFRVACMYNVETGARLSTFLASEFYRNNKELVDILDSFVLGVAFRGGAMVVVTTAVVLTTVKLRQIVKWRSETSSSLSAPEVAMTKMLIGSSVLFICCMLPTSAFRFAVLFLPELNSGRRNQNLYLTILNISDLFSVINSSFNIFVYYAMGSRYRETFKSLFRRRSDPAKA